MDSIEIFLLVNSVLVTLLGFLVGIVGFFLKDLHRDFKRLVDRVNTMTGEYSGQSALLDNLGSMYEREFDKLETRILSLESLKPQANG
jgi:hypothetical protein